MHWAREDIRDFLRREPASVLIEVKGRPLAIVESDEHLVDAHMQVQGALPGSGSRVETFSRPVVER